ncbi:MAG: TOBE domain-containing protein, partial [Chloroflexota bacterium]|nr:TOBE domain-containing protein [Chloroflexota bacterium]
DNPANKFVAGFIGSPSMNFLDVTLQAEAGKLFAVTPGFRMLVPDSTGRPLDKYVGQTVTLGVRPEHLVERSRLGGNVPADMSIPVTVDVIELLGNEIFVYLANNGTMLTARMDPTVKLTRGEQIDVSAEPDKLHFFDPLTEEAIK